MWYSLIMISQQKEFTEIQVQNAVEHCAKECAKESHDAIWGWDSTLTKSLWQFVQYFESQKTRREFYVEMVKYARKMDSGRKHVDPWTGYTIVANNLESRIAYLTPGFWEAKRNSEMLGNW